MRPTRSIPPGPPLARLRGVLLGALLALLAFPAAGPARAAAAGGDGLLCREAIVRAERALDLPDGLLQAIGLAEAGLWDSGLETALPWPWTVNAGGEAARLASKEEAIRHVQKLRAQGRTNIDVGCMQINLGWHPEAFPDIAAAFDPERNAAYGAAYLVTLREEAGSWEGAVERYHSRDPDRGRSYRERVWRHWAAGPAAPEPGEAPLLLATANGRSAGPSDLAPTRATSPRRVASARTLSPAAAPPAAVPVREAAIERAALRSVNRLAARQTWRWLQVRAAMPAEPAAGVPPMVVAALDPGSAEPAAGALVPVATLPRPLIFAGPARPRAGAPVAGRVPGFLPLPPRGRGALATPPSPATPRPPPRGRPAAAS